MLLGAGPTVYGWRHPFEGPSGRAAGFGIADAGKMGIGPHGRRRCAARHLGHDLYSESNCARPRPQRDPCSSVPSDPIITRSRDRELRVELERLRHELNVEFAARLREARAFGEVANNDDYLQIKEEKEVRRFASRKLRGGALVGNGDRRRQARPRERRDRCNRHGRGREHQRDYEYLLIGDFEAPNPTAASAGSPVGRGFGAPSVMRLRSSCQAGASDDSRSSRVGIRRKTSASVGR